MTHSNTFSDASNALTALLTAEIVALPLGSLKVAAPTSHDSYVPSLLAASGKGDQ